MNELERNKKLIADHYAAIWGGDENAVREQIAPDFVDHGGPDTPRGVEPVIAYGRSIRAVFPDMKVTLLSSVAEGDRVAVHARWRGTQKGTFQGIPATGKTITFDGMVLWRIAGGKIAERWAILDMTAAIRQLRN